MSDTKFNIHESLIKALKTERVVPFIGAGVSMAVKKSLLEPLLDEEGKERKDKLGNVIYKSIFPSWYEFLIKAADKLIKENKSPRADVVRSLLNDSPPDYLEAAQRAFDSLGQKEWYELLSENFEIDIDLADEDSKNLAKLIWQLSSNLLITTNVDLVLQSVHEKPHRVKILDTQEPEFAELQRDWKPSRPTVLHLHGHIDNEANVVFTKKQYEAFYDLDKNRAKIETLRNLFTQRTILFIGFSLDDLFILRELERVNLIYESGANSFYVLIRKSDRDNPNIPKYIEKIEFSEFGKPLDELVEELARIAKDGDDGESEQSQPENQSSEKNQEKDRLKTHFNVPFASKGDAFVGRKGLREKIWESLSKDGRTAISQIVNIKGIGGLGKTQLAVEYAHKFRDRYENGVFWLTADEDLDIQLIKIGGDLRWISESDTGFDQAALVRNRFRKLSDCLIIFDNVDDKDAIENYLPETDAHPHVLITSREKQNLFDEINLDVLSRDESSRLLLETSNRSIEVEAEQKAFEKILDELGDLPLAVELVGGFLAEHSSISFQEYLEFLEEVPLDALEEDFPSISFTHHDKSIIRTLKISEKVLARKPYLEDILDVLAWSGKSSMSYSLLQKLTEVEKDYTLTVALSDLVNLRLIKEEKNAKRYTIHRLVARVRKFEKPLAERKEWHQKIFSKLVEWFRIRKDDFNFLTEFESEIIHLQEWQSHSFDVSPVENVYATAFRAYPLWHRGSYQESKILLEEALNLYQKNSLNDYSLLANLYNDLGVIVSNLGDIQEAFRLHQLALDTISDKPEAQKSDIAKFLSNIGSTYSGFGNHQKALELQQQALEIRQELFGEKHRNIATSLSNLGSTYGELGNHQKALELKQQALEIQQELFGEKHPNTAISLGNLGSTYGRLGNHQKALELKQQALEIQQELFGEKHPNTATSLNNLGLTYGELGNHQKALELKQQALEIRQELFGEKHPNTAICLSNLGSTYGELGNHQKALELKQQALEIQQELFGEKHPDIATSLNNLGYTSYCLREKTKATEYYYRAMEMRQNILGNQHPDTINTAYNLISVLFQTGHQEEAGRLAGKFLSYVPQNHPKRSFFLEHGAMYQKARKKKPRTKRR